MAFSDDIGFSKLSSLLGRESPQREPVKSSAESSGGGHRYDPNQPRVPAGRPDGGQWSSVGAGAHPPPDDARIMSDVTPDNDWVPGARYVSRRGGGRPGSPRPTDQQMFRLTMAEALAQKAVRAVRVLEPSWRPTPGYYQTVEGQVSLLQARAREAEGRLFVLMSNGIGPGRFGSEWIWARGPERDFTPVERDIVNRIGYTFGCHTCGEKNPGTALGNFVLDHQLPTALNFRGFRQRLYPQCLSCSGQQGRFIANEMMRSPK
jgi:hypothetical protein